VRAVCAGLAFLYAMAALAQPGSVRVDWAPATVWSYCVEDDHMIWEQP
jgi:hypothetical protein